MFYCVSGLAFRNYDYGFSLFERLVCVVLHWFLCEIFEQICFLTKRDFCALMTHRLKYWEID